MVIFDFGVCPNSYLDVSRMFWLELAKVDNLKVWKIHRFDRELI